MVVFAVALKHALYWRFDLTGWVGKEALSHGSFA
jgi:hypothetical protein